MNIHPWNEAKVLDNVMKLGYNIPSQDQAMRLQKGEIIMPRKQLSFEDIERILPHIEKPGRYIGNEYNSVVKDWEDKLSLALIFPDVYEVGMSNLGLKILYHHVNKLDWAVAERAFSPWIDMERELRDNEIPLYSLETFTPLSQFDVVGFSLQYELSYSNVLTALDLGDIPVTSIDRGEEDPIVMAGGPNAFSPEPLAEFIDLFVVGEGEIVLIDVLEQIKELQQKGYSREDLLFKMTEIKGVYVPRFYEEQYENGEYMGVKPVKSDIPEVIHKRLIRDLDEIEYPTEMIVPNIDIVHNRAFVELFRGCTQGCRFCQAGMIYRPVRDRSPANLVDLSQQIVSKTGYEELSLTSLSTADYPQIDSLLDSLNDCFQNDIALSLPSLRADSFSVDLAKKVQQGKKTGLTFAPEAGTPRLRNVINKKVHEEDMMKAAEAAFKSGWDKIKLYFMIGLPTEREEDLEGIVELSNKVIKLYKQITGKNRLKLNVSTSTFVPKPHTPFQWMGQLSREEINRRQKYLKQNLNHPAINYSWTDPNPSFLEACIAKGDRKIGKVLYQAYLNGVRFDGWSDQFDFKLWEQAFSELGVNPEDYANKDLDLGQTLSWDHISPMIKKSFLKREYKRAIEEKTTSDCDHNLDNCSFCNICMETELLPSKEGRRN
ncbi:TIGR03960 family B12-binding radical SAM protein [Natranaerobius thermophilus]|uniref:Radical SAM domain protein n=1 Tax=Natranaerobius thermophilus (strain ATCC BAA-1301 / DSM 18059 / JW/NM-WN-LF) TaxID=457570 RepID=B2A6B0_NATTJ|nr:TIGR03960 family B12-binding radical SAM protein [Natranaerobius thermophilus]ACB84121.1 Radical SAM domain protein [Natranaerobius thermophilus JW/NM-WN-LF]